MHSISRNEMSSEFIKQNKWKTKILSDLKKLARAQVEQFTVLLSVHFQFSETAV